MRCGRKTQSLMQMRRVASYEVCSTTCCGSHGFGILILFCGFSSCQKEKNSPSESDPKTKQACRGLKAATCDKSLKWIAKKDAELSASL